MISLDIREEWWKRVNLVSTVSSMCVAPIWDEGTPY